MAPPGQTYRFGPFTLDRQQRVLLRDGQPIPLRPKDFDMLVVLVENTGRIVEKDELMKLVWPNTFVEEANLSHHVFTLRKALGEDNGGTGYIETVPRRGYRFVAPAAEPAGEAHEGARSSGPVWRRGAASVLAVLAAAAAVYGVWSRRPTSPQSVTRSFITLAQGDILTTDGPSTVVALSPDGRHVAYAANGRLYLRPLDRLEAVPIPGVEKPGMASARGPFFSADGRWVAYWEQRQLKKVSILGGAPVGLGEVGPPPYNASWAADNSILIGHGSRGVWRLSADGAPPETIVPAGNGERLHGPQLLPDGRSVLLTVGRGANWDEAQIVVQSLATGARRTILGGADARYLPTGHLVYALRDTVVGVRFDPASASVKGAPVLLVEGVRRPDGALGSAAQFTVSSNGTLAYLEERKVPLARRTLVWVDRQGREEPLPLEARAYVYPRISPDGSRLALDIEEDNRDIWVWDFPRQMLTRVTADPARDVQPIWTRDSQHIIFLSLRTGPGYLFRQRADGSGPAEQLTDGTRIRGADATTPDGKGVILREVDGQGTFDLTLMELQGGRAARPVSTGALAVVRSPFAEANAEISPDGRWLAYQSNDSGSVEIWLRPFPKADAGRWRVSRDGGTEPLWAPDGRQLFYRDRTGALMRVAITPRSSLPVGTPVQLFEGSSFALGGRGDFVRWFQRTYDVSPDGRRFLMIKQPDHPAAPATPERIVLIQNWFEELKAKLPDN